MISCKAISSSGGAAKYFYEKNGQQTVSDGRAEYYQKDEVRTAWGGKAAELYKSENGKPVGEGNAVSKSDLVRALDGNVVDRDGTERQMGKWGKNEAGEKVWEHRAGVDFTFSAPKSVSINSEVFGNKVFRDAHEKGVEAGMKFLEKHAGQTRINGETVNTGNLLYAKIEHSISRELDPQAHTHVLIANATYDAKSGKWYSLSNERLLEMRATADAIYKNEMAGHLQNKGYTLEFDGKGNFEVSGYTKDQLDVFSTRTGQIQEEMGKSGRLDENGKPLTWESKEVAFQKTRAAKDAPDNAEAQRGQWQERAQDVGITATGRQDCELATTLLSAKESVYAAMAHLTDREAAFSDKDLYKSASTFAHGTASYDQIERHIDRALQNGDLLHREDGKYTTKEMVEAEKHMAERLEAGKGQHDAVMTGREFDAALAKFEERKGFELTGEQRQASRDILVGNGDTTADRLQGVQGLAGTGKTTMLEFVRESAEEKGWKVTGFSNGSEQAQKMELESGIKSSTTIKHLNEAEKHIKDKELAGKAVETYEKRSAFSRNPDFGKLEKGVNAGNIQKERDSTGRTYYTTENGKTYTPGLYQDKTRTESVNINHAGATKTDYIELKDKGLSGALGGTHIMKRGGTLASEAASKLHDKIDDKTRNGGLGAQVAGGAIGQVLSKAENWQKAGTLESAAARVQMKVEGTLEKREVLNDLKQQAAGGQKDNVKELRIMDEASQSGQKEFNRVIAATEQNGARTVFLGDKLQHQGVEAGRAFEKAQANMHTSKLGEESIRRQTTDHAKEAVAKVLEGKHGEALKGLRTTEMRGKQDEVQNKWKEREATGKPLTTAEKSEMRAEMKGAAIEDNKAAIQQLAKEYTAQAPQQQRETLVITSTNADKQMINSAVRDNLKESGQLQEGKTGTMLEKTDRTETQLKSALSYQKGDTVQFQKDYKSIGVERGERGEVIKNDARLNTVTVKLESGKEVTVQPDRQQMQAYAKVEREFSAGDRVRLEKNETDRKSGFDVRNGQTGTVEKFDGKALSIKMDNGKSMDIDTEKYKHIGHAYATTSHSAQGQTVKEAWVHHNTESGRHGDREAYVNITRAKEEARVFTQNIDKAEKQAGTVLNKEAAIEKPAERTADKGTETAQTKGTLDRGADAGQSRSSDRINDKSAEAVRGKQTEQHQPSERNADKNASTRELSQQSGEKTGRASDGGESIVGDRNDSGSRSNADQGSSKSGTSSRSSAKDNSSSLSSSSSSSKVSDNSSSKGSENSKSSNSREEQTAGSGRESGGGRGGSR